MQVVQLLANAKSMIRVIEGQQWDEYLAKNLQKDSEHLSLLSKLLHNRCFLLCNKIAYPKPSNNCVLTLIRLLSSRSRTLNDVHIRKLCLFFASPCLEDDPDVAIKMHQSRWGNRRLSETYKLKVSLWPRNWPSK